MKHKDRLLCLSFSALLYGCSTGYQSKEGSFIYVTWDEGRGRLEHTIKGIEPRSFQVLEHGYAKDNATVYFQWTAIDGADPTSFAALSDIYGKDASRAYYQQLPVQNADPETFSLIDIDWAKDKNDIYFRSAPIKACDPPTFELLREEWQRDSKCAYRWGKKLSGADPNSLVIINYFYAKDKSNVYDSNGKIIQDADPGTFRLSSCSVCAKDKNRCYKDSRVVDCK